MFVLYSFVTFDNYVTENEMYSYFLLSYIGTIRCIYFFKNNNFITGRSIHSYFLLYVGWLWNILWPQITTTLQLFNKKLRFNIFVVL